MSIAAKIKLGAGVLRDHPSLIGWYVRNKLRVATLGLERKHMKGASRFARGVTLRITNACNLRCKMCRFVESGDVLTDPRQTLPLETWKSVIDDVAQYHSYITITGGEPLIYPEIGELITHISKRNLRCTVTTNGTLLAKRAPQFIEHPPDIVVVSLDGPPEVHNEVRGQPKVFERAAEGIAAVRELKKQLGKKNPILVLNCAITSYSYRHVDEILDLAPEIGVEAVNFQHQWSMTQRMVDDHNALHGDCHRISCSDLGGADPEPVDLDEMIATVRRIHEKAERLSGKMLVTSHPELTEAEIREWYADPHTWIQRRPAACAWINTEVAPNGDVEPCYGRICGNVKDDKLSKLWSSSVYREFRRHLSEAGDYPICVRCCAYFRRD